jgi:hypothetical protein
VTWGTRQWCGTVNADHLRLGTEFRWRTGSMRGHSSAEMSEGPCAYRGNSEQVTEEQVCVPTFMKVFAAACGAVKPLCRISQLGF